MTGDRGADEWIGSVPGHAYLFELPEGSEVWTGIGNTVDLHFMFHDHQREWIACAVARKKPIIAVKSGRSDAGAIAASSHTGSIAGAEVAADTLLQQRGVLRVDNFRDMCAGPGAVDPGAAARSAHGRRDERRRPWDPRDGRHRQRLSSGTSWPISMREHWARGGPRFQGRIEAIACGD